MAEGLLLLWFDYKHRSEGAFLDSLLSTVQLMKCSVFSSNITVRLGSLLQSYTFVNFFCITGVA